MIRYMSHTVIHMKSSTKSVDRARGMTLMTTTMMTMASSFLFLHKHR
jgi:hypothetical protein